MHEILRAASWGFFSRIFHPRSHEPVMERADTGEITQAVGEKADENVTKPETRDEGRCDKPIEHENRESFPIPKIPAW